MARSHLFVPLEHDYTQMCYTISYLEHYLFLVLVSIFTTSYLALPHPPPALFGCPSLALSGQPFSFCFPLDSMWHTHSPPSPSPRPTHKEPIQLLDLDSMFDSYNCRRRRQFRDDAPKISRRRLMLIRMTVYFAAIVFGNVDGCRVPERNQHRATIQTIRAGPWRMEWNNGALQTLNALSCGKPRSKSNGTNWKYNSKKAREMVVSQCFKLARTE